MNESYLVVAFRKTIEQSLASQTDALKAAYEKRLQELRAENADAAKEKQHHLESQILPGIAVYSVMPKGGSLNRSRLCGAARVERAAFCSLFEARGAKPRKNRQ